MIKTIKKFSGWPSGDYKPVMSIKITPQELCNIFNGNLCEGKDDLDYFSAVAFELSGVGPVVFIKHQNDPLDQTEVDVDRNADSAASIAIIKKEFSIDSTEFIWQADA